MFLGIDPWVRKCWYALIQKNNVIVDAWILLQKSKEPSREDYFQKIIHIKKFFETMTEEHTIKAIWIEKLFFSPKNQANAEFVYWLRWVLIVHFMQLGIDVYEYSHIELKKNISSYGKATKQLMQKTIQQIFWLQKDPIYDDAADALWLAYLASRQYT